MINLNTNISSLITQNSLKQSTNKLNIAIERMTTGFKINHPKDNAANYAITTNMTTKISSIDVAEENALMGLDVITTASDSLSLIEDRLQRLRALQEQANNGTYGEESLRALNLECNSLVDEINRLYLTTEYNGINLFLETTTDANGEVQILQEREADEDTTFEELGLGASSFSVMNADGTTIQTYDTEAEDTIGDVFDVLETHGFTCKIQSGVVDIRSSAGLYITGDLPNALGLATTQQTYVESTSQTSSTPVTYESVSTNTTEELIDVYHTTSTTVTETLLVTTTSVRTETETVQVTVTTSTTTTSTVNGTATSDTTLDDLGLSGNYTIAGVEVSGTDSLGTIVSDLTSAGVNASLTDGVLTIGGIAVEESKRVSKVSSFTNGETYYITTTDDLVALQNLVNAGKSTSGVTFELANNLNMSGVAFRGIGKDSSTAFAGTFDGNNFVIQNLTISEEEEYVGLFGYANGAIVKNLVIEDCNILSTKEYTAGLIGYAVNSAIDQCYIQGSVTGAMSASESAYAGGVIGKAVTVTITNSSVNVTVVADSGVGGFIGEANTVSLMNCLATVRITGTTTNLGGLIGSVKYGENISDCSVVGIINGNSASMTGGFIGRLVDANLDRCSFVGSVVSTGTQKIGGFIGQASRVDYSPMKIVRCYSNANVAAEEGSYVGGFMGALSNASVGTFYLNSCSVSNTVGSNFQSYLIGTVWGGSFGLSTQKNYYDSSDYSGVYYQIYDGACGAEAKTTSQIQSNLSTQGFTTANGWSVVDGKPVLNITKAENDLEISSDLITGLGFSSILSSMKSDVLTCLQLIATTLYTTTTSDVTNTITQTLTTTNTVTNTNTLWTTTTSTETKTITHYSTTTEEASGATTFGDMGVKSGFNVTVFLDGTKTNLNVTSSMSIEQFLNALQSKGLGVDFSSGLITIEGVGNSYISSSKIVDLFNLGTLNKTEAQKTVNTKSDAQSYMHNLMDEMGDVYAPGGFSLQIGSEADENSQIGVTTAFSLKGYIELRKIGLEGDYMAKIDTMLADLGAKQVEFGAAENRLVSALEEITIQRENLINSRSTLRDADIAEVSSEYIRQQILQQASATLMATANQSPSIALQLI